MSRPTLAYLTHPDFHKHKAASHVERPERLEALEKAVSASSVAAVLSPFEARSASDEELKTCHRDSVLEKIAELTASGGGNLDPDTYLNRHSDRAARLAVGGGIDLCRAVMRGDFLRGFVAARPPGHHATPTHSMGFCLYSTVAIAAKNLAADGHRVLIFDWDVHHGNGTQDCLYDHGGSCFVSIHQSPFYPGSGYSDERGVGEGEGLTYNIALPAGCGDAEYQRAYLSLVRPIILNYDPHIILVSAGYDAHQSDLLGGMKVTTDGFRKLAHWVAADAVRTSAQGRLVGFLEGGYHLGGLAESVVATLQAWTSEESPAPATVSGKVNDQINRKLLELATQFGVSGAE